MNVRTISGLKALLLAALATCLIAATPAKPKGAKADTCQAQKQPTTCAKKAACTWTGASCTKKPTAKGPHIAKSFKPTPRVAAKFTPPAKASKNPPTAENVPQAAAKPAPKPTNFDREANRAAADDEF